jgi:hypothetical protein
MSCRYLTLGWGGWTWFLFGKIQYQSLLSWLQCVKQKAATVLKVWKLKVHVHIKIVIFLWIQYQKFLTCIWLIPVWCECKRLHKHENVFDFFTQILLIMLKYSLLFSYSHDPSKTNNYSHIHIISLNLNGTYRRWTKQWKHQDIEEQDLFVLATLKKLQLVTLNVLKFVYTL